MKTWESFCFNNRYADQITDVLVDMISAHKEKDETRKVQLKEKLATQTIPDKFALFEERLSKTRSCLFAPSGLSYADLQLLTVLDFLAERKDNFIGNMPYLKALDEKVRAIPRIAEWLDKRPPSVY